MTCNCWECRLEHEYGDKIPEQEILNHGGCPHCAMTGYEGYPNNQISCRIARHVEEAKTRARIGRMVMEASRRPYALEDGNCPYCLAEGKPVGVDCIHWTGHGWTKAGRSPELAARLNSPRGEKRQIW